MKLTLRILYGLLVFLILVIYNTAATLILFCIPRICIPRKKKDVKGQRVLITGAGSGIGRKLAVEFSKQATCLILVDINKQGLLQTKKLLDSCSTVFIYECDVSDYKKVYEMAKQVKKDAGDVDILVNNAGIVNGKFLWDLAEEKIIKTMEVNSLAHFWTCKAFLPAMMKKNYGHIVSIISAAAMTGGPKLTDYCASKFAALGFAESLELELRIKKLDGIKITTVCPTIIDTDLFKGAELATLPKMSSTYVAKEIVAGVLEDKEMIILPYICAFLLTIKQIVPRWIAIKTHEITGNINTMDNFVGKGQSENGTLVNSLEKKTE